VSKPPAFSPNIHPTAKSCLETHTTKYPKLRLLPNNELAAPAAPKLRPPVPIQLHCAEYLTFWVALFDFFL
jgi:hypothetical protein